jgi:hypothetical protein
MQNKAKRRWFSFSLRTMFVLVTVLCVWLGWNVRIVQERKAILAELRQAVGEGNVDFVSLESWDAKIETSADASWQSHWAHLRVSKIRRLLGDESCAILDFTLPVDTRLVERIEAALPEAKLYARDNTSTEVSFRDSLYPPVGNRQANEGTAFKTGLKPERH